MRKLEARLSCDQNRGIVMETRNHVDTIRKIYDALCLVQGDSCTLAWKMALDDFNPLT